VQHTGNVSSLAHRWLQSDNYPGDDFDARTFMNNDIGPDETVWLLPTRRRPAKLATTMAAHLRTGVVTRGLVIVEKADWADNEAAYRDIALPPGWRYVATDGDTMGDKVRELWPLYCGARAVGLLGDDNVPETPGWDRLVAADVNGWNVLSTNDDWQAHTDIHRGRMAGATLWSGDLIRAIGWLYPPKLQHCYIDDIWERLGRLGRCWHVRMDVMVRHVHLQKHNAELDETHKKAYGFMGADREIFEAWERDDMPRCLEVIRTLRGP
jgi:hypothetical protein